MTRSNFACISGLSSGVLLNTSYSFAKTMESSRISSRSTQFSNTYSRISTAHIISRCPRSLSFLSDAAGAFGANWGKALNLVAGNWQYNVIYDYMNGTPTPMPNAIPLRDPTLPKRPTKLQ